MARFSCLTALLFAALSVDCAATVPPCGNGTPDPGEVCDDGAANGTLGHCNAECSAVAAKVSVIGDVLPFESEVEGARVAGAKISVLEFPELSTTTDASGHFEFDGLTAGSEFTLVFEATGYETTQTATVVLGAHGVDPFTIQPVPTSLYSVLSIVVPVKPKPDLCAVATTVTRLGGSLYTELRQGEQGATVSLSPAAQGASGPLYFTAAVTPSAKQTSTSIDGGVIFINVPPGRYVLSGAKAGLVFSPVIITCRAGMIVNAGPTISVQAHVVAPDYAGGLSYAADAYSASTDALCEATATCVNAKAGATNYPPTTALSCKATFKNMWSSLDPSCDGNMALHDAGKTLFDCRAKSCDLTLGDDTACMAENMAWNTAMDTYGACYAAAHPSP